MILFRYIIKSHVAPFFFSVFTLISVFLLQFLMKYADKLVGKGISAWVIIQLIIYNLAWMVVLVVPMSVLVATLMAFGGMAQNNEVAIMKASGVSLYKMSFPPILGSIIIALLLIYFQNNIYPDANHAAATLLKDINKTKPTLAIVPGMFSQEVDNYAILARNKEGDNLENVTIYDNSAPKTTNVVTAKTGKIYFSKDQKKLILDLKEGEIHVQNRIEKDDYKILKFTKHKIAMNADDFAFNKSAPGGQRGYREMGAPELRHKLDSLKLIEKKLAEQFASSNDYFFKTAPRNSFAPLPKNMNPDVLAARINERIKSAHASINSRISIFESPDETIAYLKVEIHKKYSLPIACLIFVLIGAPMGTMTRRGGFGVAAGISLTFFLIYWAFLIGGEKLAVRGIISPFLGMWSANFFMGAFGIFILHKSAKEKVELNFDWLKKLLPKQLKVFSEQNENN